MIAASRLALHAAQRRREAARAVKAKKPSLV